MSYYSWMLHICHVLLNDYYLPRTESLLKTAVLVVILKLHFINESMPDIHDRS